MTKGAPHGVQCQRPPPATCVTTTAPSHRYFEHSTAPRVNTDTILVKAIREEYPNLHLTVVPQASVNLLNFASTGLASVVPIGDKKDRMKWSIYRPATTRLGGGQGSLNEVVQFGKWLLEWKGKEFVLYLADCRDGPGAYPIQNYYLLSSSVDASNRLLLEAGSWNAELHDEVWVYENGNWMKSKDLWNSVAHADWKDVILEEEKKKALITDVESFYANKDAYERLRVPWKRGVIYYGPPGNGKTISIKAIMHTLYQLENPVPTLYVKSLASWAGPEYSINQIFGHARREAPCLLVFEDLDSMITDNVRSYFLNAVDGIQQNNGIFIIGSTNHLDRLDPGIAKRPSRFDRKFEFQNPRLSERVMYFQYWQKKLEDNKDLLFPDELCKAAAEITGNFSFAYLQEAIVAALLALARGDDDREQERLEQHKKAEEEAERKREEERKRSPWGQPPKPELPDYPEPFSHSRTPIIDPGCKFIVSLDGRLSKVPLWRQLKREIALLRGELQELRDRQFTGFYKCKFHQECRFG